jgi:hypothetical protein
MVLFCMREILHHGDQAGRDARCKSDREASALCRAWPALSKISVMPSQP